MKKTWFRKIFRPDVRVDPVSKEIPPAPGEALAQFARAVSFDVGAGETQDDAQAAHWYRKAAEQGLALAQFNLAIMYDLGQGLTKDQAEASRWFRKAADQGDAGAQFQMGKRCQRDSFNPSEPASGEAKIEAFKWFTLAAAQGYKDSEMFLERVNLYLTVKEINEGQRRSAVVLAASKPAAGVPPMTDNLD